MLTVNETKEPSSGIGSGLKNMVSNGLKVLFPFLGGKKSLVETMIIQNDFDGWYICYANCKPFAGPYAREKDAKGQLTRLRKGYTPAARLVNG